MKKGLKSSFVLLLICILCFSCSKNKISLEEKLLMQMPYLKSVHTRDCVFKHVNAGTIGEFRKINIDSIEYLVMLDEENISVICTYDKSFKTAEGVSVFTKIKKLVKKNAENIFVETATYFYIPLKDGWRAVIPCELHKFDADNIDDNMQVSCFYKYMDEELSRPQTLKEFYEWYKWDSLPEGEDLEGDNVHFVMPMNSAKKEEQRWD
ncbi:MAG: hypothetical protein J6X11_07230 [Treponema sp.]|nr:hypothetical protein [Treponema sp.]